MKTVEDPIMKKPGIVEEIVFDEGGQKKAKDQREIIDYLAKRRRR